MKKKIIFCGLIDKDPSNGETMKNHLFIERFKCFYTKVYVFNIMYLKHKPWNFFKLLWILVCHPKTQIIVSASVIIGQPLCKILRLLGKRNIFYWMVGGTFHDRIESGELSKQFYNKFQKIIVQSPRMLSSLEKSGLTNVVYIPNTKKIEYLPSVTCKSKGKIKFVFLSRIHPTKGCKEIIKSVRFLNQLGYKDLFSVDFYGKIDDCYPEFLNSFKDLENIKYKGVLNLRKKEGYDLLASYDMMLFPTYWYGEGFPGVIIDSYISGLPVIASDWNFNEDYVTESTGIIVKHKDEESLKKAMKDVIDGKYNLDEMSENSQKLALRYDNRNVITKEKLQELGLI